VQNSDKQACLLIDFENLVYSLSQVIGEDDLSQELDMKLIFNLAENYGSVVMANAYADWRSKSVNQFQIDLYRLGIDLVHVVSKKGKNAVDVKMAVDAVEAIWTLPHIKTFVIVSGDRDFIHVLKMLRRHGKTVIGVAPDNATSEDFAALCDRFLRYSALAATYAVGHRREQSAEEQSEALTMLRRTLQRILADYAETGIKGAQIKPLLRRELSPTFDESEYGFTRMSALLRSMPDILRVETPAGEGDISVFPVSTAPAAGRSLSDPRMGNREDLIRECELGSYKYEPDATARRKVLLAIHGEMTRNQEFTLTDIAEAVLESPESIGLTVTILSKYQTVLWQARSFEVEPGQSEPVRQRRIRLLSSLRDPDQFVRHYEKSIVYKVIGRVPEITSDKICDLLGLPLDDPSAVEYAGDLLRDSRRMVAKNGG
jgi:uncharacterized LabA/DUF88 family protein